MRLIVFFELKFIVLKSIMPLVELIEIEGVSDGFKYSDKRKIYPPAMNSRKKSVGNLNCLYIATSYEANMSQFILNGKTSFLFNI